MELGVIWLRGRWYWGVCTGVGNSRCNAAAYSVATVAGLVVILLHIVVAIGVEQVACTLPATSNAHCVGSIQDAPMVRTVGGPREDIILSILNELLGFALLLAARLLFDLKQNNNLLNRLRQNKFFSRLWRHVLLFPLKCLVDIAYNWTVS